MHKIAIGVTTYKRPKLLKRTLEAIAKLEVVAEVHVFVADNDPEKHEGVDTANEISALGFPFPLTAFSVLGRGFTYPRNALVARAFEIEDFDGLAIVDDDQRPEPNWLQAMIDVQVKFQADVVAPLVMPEFESHPSLWSRTSKIYFRDGSVTGLVATLSGDGGILFARRIVNLVSKPWYNHMFSLTGGADADLFLRMKKNGARFARTSKSIIHEFYPATRLSLAWAFKRSYRIGNATILIQLQNQSKSKLILRQLPKIVAGLFGGPLLSVLYFWSPGVAVDMLCKSSHACGKLAAFAGSKYLEYDQIHGD